MHQITGYQMKEEDGVCLFGGNECIFTCCIVWSREITVDMHMSSGWDMISLPLMPQSALLSDLFPGAVVVYRYTKGAGYVRVQAHESLEIGMGYWILLNEDQNHTLTGQSVEEYTLPVTQDGWAMIGGCTYPAQASLDGGSIGVIYGFTPGSGYQRVLTSLESGKGFWILCNGVMDQAELTVEVISHNI